MLEAGGILLRRPGERGLGGGLWATQRQRPWPRTGSKHGLWRHGVLALRSIYLPSPLSTAGLMGALEFPSPASSLQVGKLRPSQAEALHQRLWPKDRAVVPGTCCPHREPRCLGATCPLLGRCSEEVLLEPGSQRPPCTVAGAPEDGRAPCSVTWSARLVFSKIKSL